MVFPPTYLGTKQKTGGWRPRLGRDTSLRSPTNTNAALCAIVNHFKSQSSGRAGSGLVKQSAHRRAYIFLRFESWPVGASEEKRRAQTP